MATSRIFVRNLPVNLTEKDFRSHFAQRHAVTDVRLLPHRRIGYVGYSTPKDAEDAVKYFNKTFIRMSKLHVEPAKAANDASLHPTRLQTTGANAEVINSDARKANVESNPLKRKRPSPPPEKDDPKLQEFLNVMQAPSKSKSWKNDDVELQQQETETEAPQATTTIANESQSDDEYQSIKKKSKTRQTKVTQRDASEEPLEFGKTRKDSAASIEDTTVQDDSNWLKSKTGNLLGLKQEENDDHEEADTQDQNLQSSSAEGRDEAEPENLTRRPAAAETGNEEQPDGSADTVEAQIRASKRLFLRNLPFTITEEALVDEFSSFGTIEEVCGKLCLFLVLLHDES